MDAFANFPVSDTGGKAVIPTEDGASEVGPNCVVAIDDSLSTYLAGLAFSLTIVGGTVLLKETPFVLPKVSWDDEPYRPIRPIAPKAFGPSLYKDLDRNYAWIEFAMQKFEELEKHMIDMDMQRITAIGRATNLTERHAIELADMRKQATETALAESTRLLTLVEKRESELRQKEAKLKQTVSRSKTYRDLCNALTNIGTKYDNAARDMRNLTARRITAQPAFEKWEKQYCEPMTEMMRLHDQVKLERDQGRQELARRETVLDEREDNIKELTRKAEAKLALLEKQQQHIAEEQRQWRLQKGKELSASESKLVLKDWIEQKVKKIMPEILLEARRCNWVVQKATFDSDHAKACAAAKDLGFQEGRKEGEHAGYVRGSACGYQAGCDESEVKFQEALKQAFAAEEQARGEGRDEGFSAGRAEGYQERAELAMLQLESARDEAFENGRDEGLAAGQTIGYERGRSAGHSQGHQKGYAKGISESLEACATLSEEQRQEGYEEGNQQGISEGYALGRDAGYQNGVQVESSRAAAASTERYNTGYNVGYGVGNTAGYNLGYNNGQEASRQLAAQQSAAARTQGYNEGRTAGFQEASGQYQQRTVFVAAPSAPQAPQAPYVQTFW
ncbi:hypothetical protein J1614_007778 [Plenodomus biglobosus]|nr:hypothetical protein J1614_007778 [Plenodomus biglobosus]